MTKPAIIRHATVPTGAVFVAEGRPLEVVKVCGTDPAAPVVVIEKVAVGRALPGQYGLWALAAVTRAMAILPGPGKKRP